MNGGKDVKFGNDKRPVSIVPSNEQDLYNYANGEKLTDEFGNPLITEVDTFYLPDATAERSTSVVLPTKESAFTRTVYKGTGQANVIHADLDLHIVSSTGSGVTYTVNVLQRTGSSVAMDVKGTASTVLLRSGSPVNLDQYPRFEVRVRKSLQNRRDELYIGEGDTIIPSTVGVGDYVSGPSIIPGTFVSEIGYNRTRIYISENHTADENHVGIVTFFNVSKQVNKHDPVLKVEEQFKETSEVSNTLLGVNRAETQLSLFSNVSSYGLDPDEFETFTWSSYYGFGSWDYRYSKFYGENRYNTKESEETHESAIRIGMFPVPYSYPYGPKFEKLGIYEPVKFQRWTKFIEMGNKLYDHYKDNNLYSTDWKDKFLPIGITSVTGGDVDYAAGVTTSFSQIDTWTETWRDIDDNALVDPVTKKSMGFAEIAELNDDIKEQAYNFANTRPGYNDDRIHYAYMQSRRVFRYQPGRISGFTFGLRASREFIGGFLLEWGISNPTDQYLFRIRQGFLHIVRRSTIALEASALARSGLTISDQKFEEANDPFDTDPVTGVRNKYWTIEIPRDKFNGDPLNGNGPSGYNVKQENVTMWKIEFGWYGAIGARFYAYIPADNGDARWVVIHTLVIENSLGEPCLQDSYFRFKYEVISTNQSVMRTPQYIYKYGASYYIDGGDEGTKQIYSAHSGVKQIFGGTAPKETLIGLKPKDFILNSTGKQIINKKIAIPTKISVTSDSLAEIKVETCRACPGFGHVYTPGIAKTDLSRSVNIEFDDATTIVASGSNTFFYKTDEGAKLIAPSIWNAYIDEVSDPVGTAGSYTKATLKGYLGNRGEVLGPRAIADGTLYLDGVTGTATTIGLGTYPHAVRLSQKTFYAASDLPLSGSKIEINFINPLIRDDYGHFADFNIGITNIKPVTATIGDSLNGFLINPSAGIVTSILPDEKMLFGNYSHRHPYMNEDGVEVREHDDRVQPREKLGMDFRIPTVTGIAGGMCSQLVFDVLNEQEISDVTLISGDEPGGGGGTGFYLQVLGTLPTIDYDGGQVTVEDASGEPATTTAKFVGEKKGYISGSESYSYIEIDQSITTPDSLFTILIRPVRITIPTDPYWTKTKLYNFNPFPLYFVAKLSDRVAINNISIKETSGDSVKTTSPKLFVSNVTNNTSTLTWLGSGEVTLADGNTANNASAPTNFKGSERLSGSEIDNQNTQNIRPGVIRDTLYVGKSGDQTSQQIDMSKVFGVDKRVIAPDRDNIEATFFTAKKIDSGATGEIEMTVNYEEQ